MKYTFQISVDVPVSSIEMFARVRPEIQEEMSKHLLDVLHTKGFQVLSFENTFEVGERALPKRSYT